MPYTKNRTRHILDKSKSLQGNTPSHLSKGSLKLLAPQQREKNQGKRHRVRRSWHRKNKGVARNSLKIFTFSNSWQEQTRHQEYFSWQEHCQSAKCCRSPLPPQPGMHRHTTWLRRGVEVTDRQSPEKWAPEGTIWVSALLIKEFASLLLQHQTMRCSYKTSLPFIISS